MKNLAASILFHGTVLFAAALAAQEYPARPIKFVVAAAPGSVTDLIPRVVTTKLNQRLGWTTLVENRPGGDFAIGNQMVAQSPPDGYTVLHSASVLTILPAVQKDLPYKLSDFAPVSRIAYLQTMIAASAALPVKDFTELVAYSNANPGKLAYGGAGISSSPRLVIEAIRKSTGLDVYFVNYKTGATVVADLLGGQVPLGFTAPGNVRDHINSGKLRGLLILGQQRSPLLPNVQSMAEVGLGHVIDGDQWFAFLLPARTPKPVVDRLHKETVMLLQLAEVKEQFAKFGAIPVWDATPEAFRAKIEQEARTWEQVIREANLKF